jgi:hypothetical protein
MEKENTTQIKKTGNVPEKKFRAGAVSATVWKNSVEKDGHESSYNSVSLERVYKDKEGNWQTTNSFRQNDLPKLALVAQKAYEYVVFKAPAEA